MPEGQGWNPLRGVMDAYKAHAAKFKEGGEYGTRTGDQQAETAYQRATGAANEGGVGQSDPALEEISRSASTGRARQMSQDFDPADPESVKRMQQQLNRGGYTDKYGNALEEDGRMGELTTGAMRKMQGDRNPQERYQANSRLGTNDETIQDEESARLNLRGAAPVTQPGGDPVIANPDQIPPSSGGEDEGSFWSNIFGRGRETGGRGSGENRFGVGQGGRFR